MTINVAKSACIRIGPDWEDEPVNIVTRDGKNISWLPNMRYLGVYIAASSVFCCLFDNAKKAFYRAFNAIFGKVGRIASEEVVVHLMMSKCLPVLLYGIEVCPLKKRQIRSLDYVINSSFMKLFNTRNNEVVKECRSYFNFPDIETAKNLRKMKFLRKFVVNYQANDVCCVFIDGAKAELCAVLTSLNSG